MDDVFLFFIVCFCASTCGSTVTIRENSNLVVNETVAMHKLMTEQNVALERQTNVLSKQTEAINHLADVLSKRLPEK